MTEHRWTEGNRLVMTLLATVELTGGGARTIASVYHVEGLDVAGYVVRCVASFGVTAPWGDELCLRWESSPFSDATSAREVAPDAANRLHAQAVETRAVWTGHRAIAQQTPARKGLAS